MQVSGRTVQHIVVGLVVLTALFTLLNYVGTALYGRADGVTTIKPYGGVALALILIVARGWRWPVITAGLLGGVLAKTIIFSGLFETITIPCLTTAMLLVTDYLCQKLIGRVIDFRAWKQLVRFIAIAAFVGATSGFAYAFEQNLWKPLRLWPDWHAWFISIALSYVIFTPVIVLLATADKSALRRNWRFLAAGLAIMAITLAANFLPWKLPLLFTFPLTLLLVTLMCGIEGTALGLAMI